jgi:sugar lactone lactonase YvrE
VSAEFRQFHQGGAFFESPRWHDGRWYLSDFYRQIVVTVGAEGGEETVMEVEGQPSGIGWMPDGSMLVTSMKEHFVYRRSPAGDVSVHADLGEFCAGHLNDMVVASDGGAWAGNFGFDLMGFADPAPADLIRIDPNGSARVAAEDLMFPNGSVITADGSTLIVGETAACRYTAFDIEADGSLSNRRVWAQVSEAPEITTMEETLGKLGFGPDGCTLDAENRIWAADEVNARCALVAEGGGIVDEIPAPEGLNIFACALGGADGRTLLACAAPDFLEHNRAEAREAVLLQATVDVPHAGLP